MPVIIDGTNGITQAGEFNSDSSFGFKNRIINGAMVIDQRNAGASVTASTTSAFTYTLDRWSYYATAASKFTVQQNAGSVTTPVGFTKYLGVTSSSAYSVGSADILTINQAIEGFNIADLAWGTANAKTVTLSFQVYSSLTGTFGGALSSAASAQYYPFSYTVSSANTWTTVSITIAGSTTGTWASDNSAGLYIYFGLGVGSSKSGTAGSWGSTAVYSATGATSVVGTNGATFYITGVQLEVGSTATSFDYLDYGRSLIQCQRYYWKTAGDSGNGFAAVGSGHMFASNGPRIYVKYPVQMRDIPTIGYSGTLRLNCGASTEDVTSLAAAYNGLNTSMVQFGIAGSYTVGYGCVVHCSNATTNFLYGSSEL